MNLTDIVYDSAQPIAGYGPGFFRIGETVFRGPLLVTPWDASDWGGLDDWAAPCRYAGRIDVLLVGVGAEIAHVPETFRATVEEAGIGVDVMASPTACRTYNLLISEGRRVAVALLPV